MATDAIELSVPLPRSLDTRIFLRLSTKAKSVVLFLTTASQDELAAPVSMGSFVYALPNRLDPVQPLSTTLYSSESSVEFTTRLAKLLARKVELPVYVSNSMSFANAGMGGTVEEEMEAFKTVVQVVLERLQPSARGGIVSFGSLYQVNHPLQQLVLFPAKGKPPEVRSTVDERGYSGPGPATSSMSPIDRAVKRHCNDYDMGDARLRTIPP
ncbi:hypothetical protein NM208_g14047 [Fusarium decemcellulare]|uniref:Uncharacterized protein n=1 Tax=Fusarium decemcellulare TaxID=57161 RepID=A0ACC1RK46_9HYPO|nr:hypothetical protein NM208_g14047 [Fusarium decemcellulare]